MNVEKATTEQLENYIHKFNDKNRFWSECATFGEVVRELKKRRSSLVEDEFFDGYELAPPPRDRIKVITSGSILDCDNCGCKAKMSFGGHVSCDNCGFVD